MVNLSTKVKEQFKERTARLSDTSLQNHPKVVAFKDHIQNASSQGTDLIAFPEGAFWDALRGVLYFCGGKLTGCPLCLQAAKTQQQTRASWMTISPSRSARSISPAPSHRWEPTTTTITKSFQTTNRLNKKNEPWLDGSVYNPLPLSVFKLEMVNPVRNKKCNHCYDEAAIVNLIRTKHKQGKSFRWDAFLSKSRLKWSVGFGCFLQQQQQ